MTVGEALAEAKVLADKCLGSYKCFSSDARWTGAEGGEEWKVTYTEDWPHRYMNGSLNGRMYPIIHVRSGLGTRLVLGYDHDKGRWYLADAYLADADYWLLCEARKARDEWNS